MATSLKNMDPPMQNPPWPAGFPLPAHVLSHQASLDRPSRQAKRREVPEQEPRFETREPPYPSGVRVDTVSPSHCDQLPSGRLS